MMTSCEVADLCIYIYIYGFPEMGIPQNEWFIMENPIKIDDLGVPPSREMPIYIYPQEMSYCQ